MSTESPGTRNKSWSPEIILPRLGPCLDVQIAELTRTGGDVIVLALIVPRGHSAGRPDPDRTDRYRSTVAAMRKRRPLVDRRSVGRSELTDREKAVAALAAQALTNQQIANRLGISTHTVNFHLRQIFRKLGIESRVQLARLVTDRPAAVVDVRPR
jgi:DNA-binding CsgD family transcriptional regulator